VSDPKPLLILGTRTLAAEIADLANDTEAFRVAGFVENMDRGKAGTELDGLPIFWVDELDRFVDSHWVVCGLATTQRSRFVDQVTGFGARFATVVHPSARVSATSTIGEGTIVSAGSIIAAHTTIGRHVLVNRGALIGHHTDIGDYVSVQPGANVAGACRIGAGTYVGIGAIVLDHLSIGSGAVIGAGAVVTKDVPPNVQVVGLPARIVKEGVEGR
jgi:acetyltransferase EpsM